MAVIQISKIQVRRGLQENLPQLASGELGWSTDTRQLYIGNGVTGNPDYSPEIGVTEIITEISTATTLSNIELLQTNVAFLQSNVSTIQSQLGVPYKTITLANNTSTSTNTSVKFNSLTTNIIDYTIIRGTNSRLGTIRVTQVDGSPIYEDDYSETASTGVTIGVTGYGTSANLSYTTSSSGGDATFKYYLKSFG